MSPPSWFADREHLDWRRAAPDDAAALTELVNLAYRKYVPRIGTEPGPMREDYNEVITTRTVWLVETAGELVAALVLRNKPDALLIENVAVHPDTQGSGLGTELLGSAEYQARRAGHAAVRLYTHAAMTENIAFYLRRGFRITGRETRSGFSRVFFEKQLDQPDLAAEAGLTLAVVEPPDRLVTGRTTPLGARLTNATDIPLTVTTTPRFKAPLLDEDTGVAVGGLWGFQALVGYEFALPAGGSHVLDGEVHPRRTSRGATAAMLPRGQYGLQVRLQLHLRYPDGRERSLSIASAQHPLDVTALSPVRPRVPRKSDQ